MKWESGELVGAFADLVKKFGPDVEPFINIGKLWEREDLLSSWRSRSENHIQQTYLPGFEFQDIRHFRWHL